MPHVAMFIPEYQLVTPLISNKLEEFHRPYNCLCTKDLSNMSFLGIGLIYDRSHHEEGSPVRDGLVKV